jgi:hypothetical protein
VDESGASLLAKVSPVLGLQEQLGLLAFWSQHQWSVFYLTANGTEALLPLGTTGMVKDGSRTS